MLEIKKNNVTGWEHANLSDIPLEDLRHIKQRYRTGDLYDSFGRVLFRKER